MNSSTSPHKSIEARLIETIRTMATHPGAHGLSDDAAHLGDLILSHDTIAEGVHYRADDPPDSVGWKLAAVNLSDLAGKGAEPVGALLSLTIGDPPDKMLPGEWEEAFLRGVAAAGESYGLPLMGGDTIAVPLGAPRVLGMTVIGRRGDATPLRAGAQEGDAIVTVGTFGDAMAGLAQLEADAGATGPLVDVYRRPIPQLAAGQALAPLASAMMDVSDGLFLDADRMASASGLGWEIELDALPLSAAFLAQRGEGRDARLFAASAGDDYALLAAVPPRLVETLSKSLPPGSMVQPVGRFVPGPARVLTHAGQRIELPERLGHEHRVE